jgi:hypothetical protein
MVNPADLLRWGARRPLAAACRDPEIPHRPGLYRIRRIRRDDLDDIGQTGMGTMALRKRLGMLRGVLARSCRIAIRIRPGEPSGRSITRPGRASMPPWFR